MENLKIEIELKLTSLDQTFTIAASKFSRERTELMLKLQDFAELQNRNVRFDAEIQEIRGVLADLV